MSAFKAVSDLTLEKLNHDGTDNAETQKRQRMPSGLWGRVYDGWFRIHADRWFAVLASIVNAFILLTGVAHNIGHWTFSIPAFGQGWIFLWFYVVFLSGVAPVLMALTGGWVVIKATKHATDCFREVEINLKAQVAAAPIPQVAAELETRLRGIPRPRRTGLAPYGPSSGPPENYPRRPVS